MSPLVRSLLTLAAALVATGHPQPPESCNDNCVVKDTGLSGDFNVTLKSVIAPYPGADIKLPVAEACAGYPLSHGCGEHIVACNRNPYGLGPPPTIGYMDEQSLTPVPINCDDQYGAEVTVTVNCCYNTLLRY